MSHCPRTPPAGPNQQPPPSISKRDSPSIIPRSLSGNLQDLVKEKNLDSKLLFHIRKIRQSPTSSSSLKSTTITLDALVETLRKYHREYKRGRHSELSKFRQLVKIHLDTIVQAEKKNLVSQTTDNNRTQNLKTNTNSTPSIDLSHQPKKRKWKGGEEEEEQYEREARQIETSRAELSSTGSGGGSMLNASLRQKYTEQNQKIQRDGNTDTPAFVEEGNNNVEATASIKKKKKKRITSSSSSSSARDGTNPSLNLAPIIPKERYSDLGGMDKILAQIRELIEYPLLHPELFSHLGVDPPRGVLLRGPPGVGKTHLANAVAGEVGVKFFNISAPEIIGGVSGESEARVRELFQTAAISSPALIFIDEIDAIAPKRGEGKSGGGNSMEKRIVAQLLTCMDSLAKTTASPTSHVMVIGATNRPDAIDPALRRAGRFDREICLGVPDEQAREGILRKMASGMRLIGDFDFASIAKKTPGFVGADMRSLTKEAAVVAINRIFKTVLVPPQKDETNHSKSISDKKDGEEIQISAEDKETSEENASSTLNQKKRATPLTAEQLSPLFITMDDFLAAVSSVQPSSKREGFATVPGVTWDDIGALNAIRDELALSVLEPIHHPERFKQLGLPLPAGVMLYGPPGCGKTLLAKAISNESGANFISVKGPELLDKYVGESERAVRQVFERARSSSPCVVFFDELDSLCPKRGTDSGGGGVSERVVNQLLTEMDGLETRSSVFVIAATNRPELIDPAMLRPGRLDKLLYVPLPAPDDRASILQAISSKVKLASDVNLVQIAKSPRANGFSGADCAALLREAGLAVLRDCHGTKNDSLESLEITNEHFDYAFDHVMPSVSKKDQAKYDRMRDRMARARTRGSALDENSKVKQSQDASATPPDEVNTGKEVNHSN